VSPHRPGADQVCDEIDKKLAELKTDGWVTMFKNRNDACGNPDLSPW
jgi:hypothetical protein